MNPTELRQEANILLNEIGSNAKLSIYTNGELHHEPIGAMLYNGDDQVRIDGFEWGDVFDRLRKAWYEQDEDRRRRVAHNMALTMIVNGAANGIVSERILQLTYGLRDVNALRDRALEEAKRLSSRDYIIV